MKNRPLKDTLPSEDRREIGKQSSDRPEIGKVPEDRPKIGKQSSDRPEIAKQSSDRPEIGKVPEDRREIAKVPEDRREIAKVPEDRPEIGKVPEDRPKIGKQSSDRPEIGKQIVQLAPTAPGCYLFYDGRGFVIYAGKSKNLKGRMRQYFYQRDADWSKVREMVGVVNAATFLTTGAELDALLLEHRLIKVYKPRYNAQLKSDRAGLFLRISRRDAFPALAIVSERAEDEAAYYGGIRDRFDGEKTLEILNSAWRLPLCGRVSLTGDAPPCFYHHLSRCDAPCAGRIDRKIYGKRIREARDFLEGKNEEILKKLALQMERATEKLVFEQAAEIRDHIQRLRRLRSKIGGFLHMKKDETILFFARPYHAEDFSVFVWRAGTLTGRMDADATMPTEQLIARTCDMISSPPAEDVCHVRPLSICSSESAVPPRAVQEPECRATDLLKALSEIYIDRMIVPIPEGDPSCVAPKICDAIGDFLSGDLRVKSGASDPVGPGGEETGASDPVGPGENVDADDENRRG